MSAIQANKGTILVVADGVERLELLRAILENHGYTVQAAMDGESVNSNRVVFDPWVCGDVF